MKLTCALLLVLSAGLALAGQVTLLEPTPPEIAQIGVTYEKIAFTFPDPVKARFWIEYDSGEKKALQTMEVPRDHATPTRHYTLVYVQTAGHQASLTAVTDSAFPLNRRSCSLGSGDIEGSRHVATALTSLNAPLAKDLTLYTATIKPGYRHSDLPDKIFTIKARFDAP